ncbi:MAG TPA: translation initiation factor IF-1 [Candidatus Hydrogenedentes bacterium]|nr:translation initiation factor IF-1 [Candidatus Hydrogenedentota bacterium]HQH51629.1 translation initiation factor IF-1 [Candidatus Hydrogenedentota bacterium]HQM49960.1 translation initiation factor IF-1 [Candidatus Hydrogenedentota bacterium]
MSDDAGKGVAGTVTEALPSGVFRVELDTKQVVLAHIAGKDSMRFVRVLPGDRVKVVLSPYDHGRGRIVERFR